METNYSLSDIAAVSRDANIDGLNGNGAWWIIILFLFMFGNNGWNRNNTETESTLTETSFLMNSQFQNLDRNVQSISDRQFQQNSNFTKGLCDLGYEISQQSSGTNSLIGTEARNLQMQISNCCCENRLATANLSAQTAQQTYEVANAILADGDKTRAAIQNLMDKQNAYEMQQKDNRIAQLELAQAMSGVVRYPNGYTYNAGASPFCACNNNCCGNAN